MDKLICGCVDASIDPPPIDINLSVIYLTPHANSFCLDRWQVWYQVAS